MLSPGSGVTSPTGTDSARPVTAGTVGACSSALGGLEEEHANGCTDEPGVSHTKRRTLLMQARAAGAKEKMAEQGKRKLRVKVRDVLREVQKRQALKEQQDRHRKFREECERAGRGASAALGDADVYALGLVGIKGKITADGFFQGASPRRSCLLRTLSLEDLDMLRRDPGFFFSSPTLADAPTMSEGSNEKGQTEEAQVEDSLESIINFFAVAREDAEVPVTVYAQKLRAQLVAEAAAAASLDEPEPVPPSPTHGHDTTMQALERMPCHGRRPWGSSGESWSGTRKDEESPTLMKVKEVYQRRDALDSKWQNQKHEAMERRINVNAFKSREQKRELELQALQKAELHKVRLIQAQRHQRRQQAQSLERAEVLEYESHAKLVEAADRSEDVVEERRSKVGSMLDHWYDGVLRGEQTLRNEERERHANAKRKQIGFNERLSKVSEKKKGPVDSLAQKNGALRSRIQSSLMDQLAEQRRDHRDQLAEDLDAKIAKADENRRNCIKGARYNFIDKAFGKQAMDFDAKHHYVSTDRRSSAWRNSVEELSIQSPTLGGGGSRSEPNLSLTFTEGGSDRVCRRL